METKKFRFSDAQKGDKVYSMIHGDCVIIGKGMDLIYIESYIHDFTDMAYDFGGNYFHGFGEPILFYRKGSEKYLTERPEPEVEVDWAKVPQGIKVKVWNTEDEPQDFCTDYFMAYFPELKFSFWTFNDANKSESTGYKYCKLAEPCKPEWRK